MTFFGFIFILIGLLFILMSFGTSFVNKKKIKKMNKFEQTLATKVGDINEKEKEKNSQKAQQIEKNQENQKIQQSQKNQENQKTQQEEKNQKDKINIDEEVDIIDENDDDFFDLLREFRKSFRIIGFIFIAVGIFLIILNNA